MHLGSSLAGLPFKCQPVFHHLSLLNTMNMQRCQAFLSFNFCLACADFCHFQASECKITYLDILFMAPVLSEPVLQCIANASLWGWEGKRHYCSFLDHSVVDSADPLSPLSPSCSSSPSSWSFSSPRWQLEWWPWRTPPSWVSALLPPAPFVFYFHGNSHHIPTRH